MTTPKGVVYFFVGLKILKLYIIYMIEIYNILKSWSGIPDI